MYIRRNLCVILLAYLLTIGLQTLTMVFTSRDGPRTDQMTHSFSRSPHEGFKYPAIENSETSQPKRYSPEFLKRLRKTADNRLPGETWDTIKELGIGKRNRGCRAGTHIVRRIATITGLRSQRPDGSLADGGRNIANLVPIKRIHERRAGIVNYDDVLNLERSVSYIELDYTTKDDNEMKVDINFNQGKGDKEKMKGALILVRTVLAATRRRESNVSQVSLPELEEPVEKKRSETERLDDEFLLTVAEEIETDELLESLMIALKIAPAARRRCLDTNRLEGRVTVKGTNDMLITWRAQTEVAKQRSRFKKALKRARLMDLRSRLFPEED